ncbi:GapS4a family protein [Pseudomonas putida]
MGEWSKSIGEHGEDIVFSFLKFIGWKAAVQGIDVTCIRPPEHKRPGSNSERTSHGIDYVYTGQSPLEDGVLKHLCISSKFSTNAYLRPLTTTFKGHFSDLATAIECFRRSPQKKRLNDGYTGITAEVVAGVLFWINGEDTKDFDAVSEIAFSKKLEDANYGTIYVVDNRRACFLYEAISFMRNTYGASNVKFLYPSTGKNVDPSQRIAAGDVLPAEYLTSGIIPFFIQAGDSKSLAVCCDDEFSEEGLRRLIGYLSSVALDFPQKVVIAFPDYNFSDHSRQAALAKGSIANKSFAELVEVVSYRSDFRGIA